MKVAAIVGPTAVGKSEVAVEVAERVGAEIVSVDSMQIYRGMDAGTAKPGSELRARVRHYLLDVVEPDHWVTVAEFQLLAREAIQEIAARGRLPLLVGGSGLYFRAVVDDLEFPPRAPEIRHALEAKAEEVGARALHARLAELDPAAAARIEPGNLRRTVRALEVIELTGRPFSDNDSWERYDSVYELAVAGLTRPREDLWARIEERVDRMLAAGLLEEARALDDRGLGPTARQALGYRQVLDESADDVREGIIRATKRFARRQESWFKADPRITWYDAAHEETAEQVAAFLAASLGLPLEP
ncbi:MAG: tRNA (adenosine(37)-N6)-dimethylallyltransferase MiaA [Actinomycetota bacterium]